MKDINKKVTISISSKSVKSLEEVCKILGGTVISTEYTIKPTINSWDDLITHIEQSVHNGEEFINKLIELSPEAAAWFLVYLITDNNNPSKPAMRSLKDYLQNTDWTENEAPYTKALKIIKDKFLPLLHGKGEQKD